MIRMVLTSALMLLVITSTAFSQVAYDLTGTGARAEGMGKAFIAVSDDASAASWNPAGLTHQDRLMMGFDIDHFAPDNKFNVGSDQFLANQNFSDVSQFSIIAPFRFRGRPMVMGLSYGRAIQEFWNQGARDSVDWINQAGPITGDSSYALTTVGGTEHDNLSVINFAVGTKLKPNLSGGLGINIYTGKRVSNSLTARYIPHYTKAEIYPQYVEQTASLEVIDTASYSGANFSFGLKYHGEKMDFGFLARSAFDLKSESDAKFNNRTVENGLLQRLGSDTIYIDNQLVKVGMPWVFGFGIASRPREGFTVAADFEYRAWSGQEVKIRDSIHIRPGSDNEEFYTVYDLEFRNTTAIRVGFEYLWNSPWESFPVIPFRAGFSTVAVPLTDLNADTDPNDGIDPPRLESSNITSLHFGTGVKWSLIYLDFAYTWSKADVPYENYDYSWDNTSSNFVFGFTGYF